MKIILTYVDSDEKAEEIAEVLLKERLAACVGILPGKSRYRWKGKIEHNENELHLIIKTKPSLVNEVIKKIKDLHSYELPVIDVINAEPDQDVENWLEKETK